LKFVKSAGKTPIFFHFFLSPLVAIFIFCITSNRAIAPPLDERKEGII
jgi:hypothetical protein